VDEIVAKFYRRLIREGCQYTGILENPSIFLDSVGEKMSICAKAAQTYIHLYVNMNDAKVKDIKYLCMCDPVANVAAELLCSMVRGQPVQNVKSLTENSFSEAIGGKSADLNQRARGLLELLNIGIDRYLATK
jgi:NifU-like protein involved in Fe-S cluster formation